MDRDLKLFKDLRKLIQRAKEIIEQRGPSGQRLYDAPVEEWMLDAEELEAECHAYLDEDAA